jgi:hypothetical protein
VPNVFPEPLPCSEKERPQTLYHVHYVCTRVVTTSGRGDSCPNLVYSATFVVLLRHPVSSSEYGSRKWIKPKWNVEEHYIQIQSYRVYT